MSERQSNAGKLLVIAVLCLPPAAYNIARSIVGAREIKHDAKRLPVVLDETINSMYMYYGSDIRAFDNEKDGLLEYVEQRCGSYSIDGETFTLWRKLDPESDEFWFWHNMYSVALNNYAKKKSSNWAFMMRASRKKKGF
jgi:hypothetical protein